MAGYDPEQGTIDPRLLTEPQDAQGIGDQASFAGPSNLVSTPLIETPGDLFYPPLPYYIPEQPYSGQFWQSPFLSASEVACLAEGA